MRKSTLFVSAALTTFMLVMLFGVVSAYQTATGSNPINATTVNPIVQQQPVVGVVDTVSMEAPVTAGAAPASVLPAQPAVVLSAEDAALLVAKITGRTDLYSVESSKLDGVDAYLVTFSSGDIVYISLTGQILSITKPQVYTATDGGGSAHRGGRVSGGGGAPAADAPKPSGGGGGEHEGGEPPQPPEPPEGGGG